jgi:hypothetical protein
VAEAPIPTPQTQPTVDPPHRHIDAGRGFTWWADSASWMFRDLSTLGLWIGMIITGLVISLVLGVIPLVGHMAAHVLWFVFAGGLALAAQKTAMQANPQFSDMFSGFGPRGGALLGAGLLLLLALVAVFALMMVIGVVAFFHTVWIAISASPLDAPDSYLGGLGGALAGLLVCVLLLIPISMAAWFAPALIVLRGAAPVDALRASYLGCQRHFGALTVYGLIWLGLAFVATLLLGLGWLFLLPWMFVSTYAAFVDIFGDASS